jgi:tetratricopeptide (TPR) repeat protein
MLRQFGHEFDAALADLAAAVQQDPDDGEAWAWLLAIHLVQAHYDKARAACAKLAELAEPLIAAGCRAQIDSLTGRAGAAADALRAALRADDTAGPEQRLWSFTRLAEIEERRGRFAEAEAAFRAALALGLPDVYLLSAYADFLLDRGRAAEVLALLKDSERSDLLLLRLAIAGKAAGAPPAPPGCAATRCTRRRKLASRWPCAARRNVRSPWPARTTRCSARRPMPACCSRRHWPRANPPRPSRPCAGWRSPAPRAWCCANWPRS